MTAAEQAYEAYAAKEPWEPSVDFIAGFLAGHASRDAEVVALTKDRDRHDADAERATAELMRTVDMLIESQERVAALKLARHELRKNRDAHVALRAADLELAAGFLGCPVDKVAVDVELVHVEEARKLVGAADARELRIEVAALLKTTDGLISGLQHVLEITDCERSELENEIHHHCLGTLTDDDGQPLPRKFPPIQASDQ